MKGKEKKTNSSFWLPRVRCLLQSKWSLFIQCWFSCFFFLCPQIFFNTLAYSHTCPYTSVAFSFNADMNKCQWMEKIWTFFKAKMAKTKPVTWFKALFIFTAEGKKYEHTHTRTNTITVRPILCVRAMCFFFSSQKHRLMLLTTKKTVHSGYIITIWYRENQ